MEGKGFRDGIEAFRRERVVILGISFDTVSDNAAFASKFNFNFDLLCDTDREVGLLYGACDSPEQQSARRISYLIGEDGTILRAYDRVKPAEHPAQVLADVKARG